MKKRKSDPMIAVSLEQLVEIQRRRSGFTSISLRAIEVIVESKENRENSNDKD